MQEPSKSRLINRWSNFKQPCLTELKCYICDYSNTLDQFKEYKSNDVFEAGELIRYQCPQCDVIFGDMRFLLLDKSIIEDDYTDLYSYYSEGNTTKYILEVLESLEIYGDKSKSYLDYACGKWNTAVDNLKIKGYNSTGYDKYVGDGKIILNDITDLKFDVIFSCNFIEHLINPIEDIIDILEHINNDGYLIFITSCFEYCIDFTHYHTFFFVGRSLEFLCKRLNLRIVESKKIVFDDGEFTTVNVLKRI